MKTSFETLCTAMHDSSRSTRSTFWHPMCVGAIALLVVVAPPLCFSAAVAQGSSTEASESRNANGEDIQVYLRPNSAASQTTTVPRVTIVIRGLLSTQLTDEGTKWFKQHEAPAYFTTCGDVRKFFKAAVADHVKQRPDTESAVVVYGDVRKDFEPWEFWIKRPETWFQKPREKNSVWLGLTPGANVWLQSSYQKADENIEDSTTPKKAANDPSDDLTELKERLERLTPRLEQLKKELQSITDEHLQIWLKATIAEGRVKKLTDEERQVLLEWIKQSSSK